MSNYVSTHWVPLKAVIGKPDEDKSGVTVNHSLIDVLNEDDRKQLEVLADVVRDLERVPRKMVLKNAPKVGRKGWAERFMSWANDVLNRASDINRTYTSSGKQHFHLGDIARTYKLGTPVGSDVDITHSSSYVLELETRHLKENVSSKNEAYFNKYLGKYSGGFNRARNAIITLDDAIDYQKDYGYNSILNWYSNWGLTMAYSTNLPNLMRYTNSYKMYKRNGEDDDEFFVRVINTIGPNALYRIYRSTNADDQGVDLEIHSDVDTSFDDPSGDQGGQGIGDFLDRLDLAFLESTTQSLRPGHRSVELEIQRKLGWLH